MKTQTSLGGKAFAPCALFSKCNPTSPQRDGAIPSTKKKLKRKEKETNSEYLGYTFQVDHHVVLAEKHLLNFKF